MVLKNDLSSIIYAFTYALSMNLYLVNKLNDTIMSAQKTSREKGIANLYIYIMEYSLPLGQ